MEECNSFEKKKIELVLVAQSILDGKMDLIEGVRNICSLRPETGDPDNEVFLLIRAIESETDHYPVGQTRKRCSAEYLHRMDIEKQRYIEDAMNDIFNACKKIVKIYSQPPEI